MEGNCIWYSVTRWSTLLWNWTALVWIVHGECPSADCCCYRSSDRKI